MRKLTILLLLSILITGVSVQAEDTKSEVDLLFTHDLHSYLDPREMDGESVGGVARLDTRIKEKREENEATFVLDGGDFSMGTLYQTIYEDRAVELTMLGKMGYDVTTIGNHEFDYRGEGFANMLNSAVKRAEEEQLTHMPTLLSANINWDESISDDNKLVKKAMDDYGSVPYTIIERGGIKLGIYGVMGKDADECAPLSGLVFDDIITVSKEMTKKLKAEGADIIVCMSHSGTWEDIKVSEDEQLAKEVPEIDVIISGHTHTVLEEPIVSGDTYIMSAGCYGTYLGEASLTQKENGRWELKEYQLKKMDHQVAENPEITAELKEFQAEVEKGYLSQFDYRYEEVLAYNDVAFTPIEKFALVQEEDPLGSLIADSYIYAVKQAEGEDYEPVDLAVVASGVIRESIPQGEVKVSDVFQISSLGIGPDRIPGYPLVSVYLTGKEIKTVAELDASISPLMTTAQLYPANVSWTFNPNRLILNKVTDTVVYDQSGKAVELKDDQLYRVVSGLYETQMLGAANDMSYGILSLKPKDRDGNLIEDFEQHIIYDAETGREVKEWAALADYISSFEKEDGVSVIPSSYEKPEGRKVIHDSKNLIDLLKHPNKIFFALCAIILVVILIVTAIVRFCIKRRKKKKDMIY